jgi:hypothetical protein
VPPPPPDLPIPPDLGNDLGPGRRTPAGVMTLLIAKLAEPAPAWVGGVAVAGAGRGRGGAGRRSDRRGQLDTRRSSLLECGVSAPQSSEYAFAAERTPSARLTAKSRRRRRGPWVITAHSARTRAREWLPARVRVTTANSAVRRRRVCLCAPGAAPGPHAGRTTRTRRSRGWRAARECDGPRRRWMIHRLAVQSSSSWCVGAPAHGDSCRTRGRLPRAVRRGS